MHSTSELHNEILANPAHQKEVKAVIAGVEHGEAQIISGAISGGIFEKPGTGNCIAKQLDLQVFPVGKIPKQAEINIYVRLVLPDPATREIVQAAEWLPKGTYFIDEQPEDDFGVKSIVAYDAMLKAEEIYLSEGDTGEWPRPMETVVNDIAQRIGVDLDGRTVINPAYMVEYPNALTMREILSNVASAHSGNWIITDDDKLLLIGLAEILTQENHVVSAESAEVSDAFQPYSKVIVWYDDENAYQAGDDSGRTLEIDCIWATQAMADDILASVRGFVYQPYSASNVPIDPAAELGDGITINGISSAIEKININIDRLWAVDISAPWDEEVDHEYQYLSPEQRALARKVTLGTSYYGTSITRKEGLVIEKTDGENVSAKAVLNAEELSFYDADNDRVLYFDPVTGTYKFKGELNVSDNFVVDKDGNVTMNGSVTIAGSLKLTGEAGWLKIRYSTNKDAAVPGGWSEDWDDAWSNTTTQVWAIYSYDGGTTWTQPMLAQGSDGQKGDPGDPGQPGSDANIPAWVQAYTASASFNSLVTNEWVVTMNLYASKLYGVDLYGDTITLKSKGGYEVGTMSLQYSETYAFDLTSNLSLRMQAASGYNAHFGVINGPSVSCSGSNGKLQLGGKALVLASGSMYGSTLPSGVQAGQVFFLI